MMMVMMIAKIASSDCQLLFLGDPVREGSIYLCLLHIMD